MNPSPLLLISFLMNIMAVSVLWSPKSFSLGIRGIRELLAADNQANVLSSKRSFETLLILSNGNLVNNTKLNLQGHRQLGCIGESKERHYNSSGTGAGSSRRPKQRLIYGNICMQRQMLCILNKRRCVKVKN